MKKSEKNCDYCCALGSGIDVALKIFNGGFRAYPVGGAVRDVLLGRKPTEVDITTDAPIEVVKKIFPEAKVVFPEKYQILHLKFGAINIEISRMREDVINYGRQASVRFTSDLSKDLARRDFTVNAIALDPRNKSLIDEHKGLNDLQKKLLRSIGNPRKRFLEDNLRILRAVRFSAQLRFKMEPQLLSAVMEMAHLTANLSPAWVFREFSKGVKHNPAGFKRLLDKTGIGKSIFGKDWEEHNDFALLNRARFFKKVPEAIVWLLFFGKDSKELFARLMRMSSKIEFPRKLRKDIIYACELWEAFPKLNSLSSEDIEKKLASNPLFQEYCKVYNYIRNKITH